MFHKKEEKSKINNNGGFSLIEVIVSLLVLAVITVPLLNMFMFSSKANAMSDMQQAATDIGNAVMEEIRAKGVEKWAEDNSLDLGSGNAAFSKNIGQKILPVEVTWKAVDHTTSGGIQWNSYQMADLSDLSSSSSAIINPFARFISTSGKGDSEKVTIKESHDDSAVQFFLTQHTDLVTTAWINYVNKVGLEESDKAIKPVSCDQDYIRGLISRKMVITVEPNPGKTGVTVSAKLVYTVTCNASYHFGKNYASLAYDTTVPSEGENEHEWTMVGVYAKKEFDALRSIYLFHAPLEGTVGTWHGEDEIALIDTSSEKSGRKLFVAPQLLDRTTNIKTKVKTDLEWTTYYLKFDERIENKYLLEGGKTIPEYQIGEGAPPLKEDNILVDKLAAEVRLYDVVVKVTDPKSGKLLINLTLEGR